MTRIKIPSPKQFWFDEETGQQRRGAFMVLALFCLVACTTFVAFSVDVGLISLTQTRMQNAVDSAALAAAMEITFAVENAGPEVEDVIAFAQAASAAKAAEVAGLNGVYVDPNSDVEFGHRSYNDGTGQFEIEWGASPSNVVKVRARRDNDDLSAPDGKLPTLFAGVNGTASVEIVVSAVAYVEARDIVTVLDFSRSMNFDSYFAEEYEDPTSQMSQVEIESNMYKVWEDLGYPTYGNMGWTPDWVTIPSVDNGEVDVTWRTSEVDFVAHDYDDSTDFAVVYLKYANGNGQYFYPDNSTETFSGSGSNSGQRVVTAWVKDDGVWEEFDFYDNDTIKRGLGLTNVSYPYPVGNWDRFINMCREHSSSSTSYYQYEIYAKGYRRKFGMLCFIHYIMRFESGHWETPDLYMTRHYPFHSVKSGEQLFCDFLENLAFDDHLGLVSYDTSHRIEDQLSESGMPAVDISGNPLTNDYDAIRTIIQYKQAAHYSYATNMGGGLKDAKWLLDNYGREGARPTILLMTDGNTNTMDSGESSDLPGDWNWDTMFDFDGNGVGDYYTDNSQKRYALRVAKEAVDAGYTIHTMSVGADADRELMQAIAWLSEGIWIDVPGGATVAGMQTEIEEAFRRIAAFVPPAKLLSSEE
ncbi:MAG: hypothetical protein DWQ34_19915 [Planctomycetota bacterium]|nr:MAG: hypothetical protein DWQ29_11970 [Planctomycetota bacterium]REJ89518.1 MAG: hypothetical protein DWQ34_19915 [Planctomycetota bacterium]REK28911.1 MAG: hypothetical protein DWQ41_05000 [Planctomycetota bacterium]REK39655.1 MAG: hypothetical protein DWQ45_01945 [Planctomycetota bacterium]